VGLTGTGDRGGSTVDQETRAQDRSAGGDPVTGDAGVVVVPLPWPRRVDPARPASSDGSGAFTVDCADCAHRDTPVCDDCVVSFIVGREPDDAVVVDADEARAVRLLTRAGLVPGVRHQAQASGL
jgi:hypothetical protein